MKFKNFLEFLAILLCFMITIIFLFYEPISSNFETWTDKATVVQTIFTVFASIIAIIALVEYLRSSMKAINPFLITEQGSIYNFHDNYPLKHGLDISLRNEGNKSIEKDRLYYSLYLPTEYNIAVRISGVPVQKKISNQNAHFYHIGGSLTSLVLPRRHTTLFNISFDVTKPCKIEILYYLTTEEGFYPRTIKTDKHNQPIEGFGKLVFNYS